MGHGPLFLLQLQRYEERGSLSGRAAGRNRAPMPLGDLAADGQADAGPRILVPGMEALKQPENPV
jgi:hypothetical protein